MIVWYISNHCSTVFTKLGKVNVKNFIVYKEYLWLVTIHPSIFFCLSGAGLPGQLSEQGHPHLPLPGHFLHLFQEVPKAFPGQPSDIVAPACPGSSSGSTPAGHARHTSRGRRPEGNQYRCPSHLSWLLSMWRSSDSTPSSSRVTELLTLSLRERPATLRRKLISAAGFRDLILSVMTQSSWP